VLDNLRRARRLHRDLVQLRDRLLGSYAPAAIAYSVRFIGEPSRNDAFTSYTGTFAPGDRLLLADSAWQVEGLEEDDDARERLVCAPFSPG
jgi:hypothetical protein